MPSVFSRIISGEFPGRFLWRDKLCVSFLSINPLAMGHALVVPRIEVDHWLDLDDATSDHLYAISRHIGRAQMVAFAPARIGLLVAGFEVPHVHLHVVPVSSMDQLNFANAAAHPEPADLDEAEQRLVAAIAANRHPPGD